MRRTLAVAALMMAVTSLTVAKVESLPDEKQAKIETIKQIISELDDDRRRFDNARTELAKSEPSGKPEYAPSEIDQALEHAIRTLEGERALTRLALGYTSQRLERLTKLAELSSYLQRLRTSNKTLVDGADKLLTNEAEQLEMLKLMQQAFRANDAARWNSLNGQYSGIQARGRELSLPVSSAIDEQEKILAEATLYLHQLLAELQKAGFTGTKTVRLTAKSWINGSGISGLISYKGAMLKLGPNVEPSSSELNPAVDDFKMYQTFSAEVTFKDGVVVAARFLPETLSIKAGKTLKFFEGTIYIKESTISDWKGKDSVTFTRTVEALPQVLFAEALGNKNEGFRPIYSTLSVEVTGDKIVPHGYGSDFPSHKFWLDDQPLPEKKQMQPSEYFK